MEKYKVKSIKYNFIMNFILTVSNFLFPLLTFPYVSRVLQVEANGKVAFVSSIVSYFMMIGSLGIPTYGIRAASRVRDNKKKLSVVVQELLIINLCLVAIVLCCYFVAILNVKTFYEYRELFYINAVGILLNVLGMNWFFQAIEQYDYITIRSIVFRIISIILLFTLIHNPSDYVLYTAILVFSGVGSNILNLKRVFKFVSFKKADRYKFSRHFRPILVMFAQTLVVSIYTNLDTVMLGFIKGNFEVGLYNASIKVKGLLLSVVTSLGNVLLPRMSYYVKNNMKDKFLIMMTKAINFTLLMALPLSIFFVLCAKESILLLAGPEYLGAVLGMQFLVIAVIPNALTGVLGMQVLVPLEKENFVLYSVIVGAIIDFVLNIIFIPLYGVSGASFSTMIAEVIVLSVQIYYTRTYLLQIRNNILSIRYISATIIASILILLLNNIEISNFLLFMIKGITFFGSYLLILFVKKEELILENVNFIIKKYRKK